MDEDMKPLIQENIDDQFEIIAKTLFDFAVLKNSYLSYKYLSEHIRQSNKDENDILLNNYLSVVGIIFIKMIVENKIKNCIKCNTLNIMYDPKDNVQIITAESNVSLKLLRKIDYKLHQFQLQYFVNKIDDAVDSRLYIGLRNFTDPMEFLHYALPDDDAIRDMFQEMATGGYSRLSRVINDTLFSSNKMFNPDEFHLVLFVLLEYSSSILANFVNGKDLKIIKCTNRHPVFGFFHGLFFTVQDFHESSLLDFKVLGTCNKVNDTTDFILRYRQEKVHFFLTFISKFMYQQKQMRADEINVVNDKKSNVIDFTARSGTEWKKNFDNHRKMIADILDKM